MATEAVTATEHERLADPTGPPAVPYPPSWVDRLLALIERLPGPTTYAYVVLGALLMILSVGQDLVSGTTDPGKFAANAFWGFVIALTLWLVHHLAGVAGESFDDFRPLLDTSDADAARSRYELMVTPALPALAILAFSAVFTPLYWVIDPAASAVIGMQPVALVVRFFSEGFFGALVMVFIYQSIRQLRAVDRLHAAARRIDLFRPAPLYAFSILTSRTAIVLALVFTVTSAVAAAQSTGADSGLLFVGYAAAGVLTALVVFIVPLLGMRRRITAEKRRLQGAVGQRIEASIEVVHAAVDAGDMPRAAGMHDVMSVLVAERELVDRLPTLPWRPGTLGAVLTAIALPIGLSIATRLLERII